MFPENSIGDSGLSTIREDVSDLSRNPKIAPKQRSREVVLSEKLRKRNLNSDRCRRANTIDELMKPAISNLTSDIIHPCGRPRVSCVNTNAQHFSESQI